MMKGYRCRHLRPPQTLPRGELGFAQSLFMRLCLCYLGFLGRRVVHGWLRTPGCLGITASMASGRAIAAANQSATMVARSPRSCIAYSTLHIATWLAETNLAQGAVRPRRHVLRCHACDAPFTRHPIHHPPPSHDNNSQTSPTSPPHHNNADSGAHIRPPRRVLQHWRRRRQRAGGQASRRALARDHSRYTTAPTKPANSDFVEFLHHLLDILFTPWVLGWEARLPTSITYPSASCATSSRRP
jgi:hypothetical protein